MASRRRPRCRRAATSSARRSEVRKEDPPHPALRATFSPLGRRGWRRRWWSPLPAGERSAERSGGRVRGLRPNVQVEQYIR
ncbi:hypothetical protein EN943_10980 [Mesorhizobium sp. M7A.F.Ca.US.006.01.1.1]|nr:hypothetical protein EN943_10980 [Mesorhizobium sp. M7A.F.Ca.US.006.01.1.1]